jgi:manganese transport protein
MAQKERIPSLPEVHRTIKVPEGRGFWRKMLAYAGPGYLVAVGYMDPGNWATDLAGGAQFGYLLLSVILLSNLLAIVLQALCVKLGVATGRDLAQACRDNYSPRVSFFLWILCEIAIAACDLAELVGSAIALQLLFNIPLAVGVCITALDVMMVLFLQGKGFRYVEALVITVITVIDSCSSRMGSSVSRLDSSARSGTKPNGTLYRNWDFGGNRHASQPLFTFFDCTNPRLGRNY